MPTGTNGTPNYSGLANDLGARNQQMALSLTLPLQRYPYSYDCLSLSLGRLIRDTTECYQICPGKRKTMSELTTIKDLLRRNKGPLFGGKTTD
jgi:hypothetical protein